MYRKLSTSTGTIGGLPDARIKNVWYEQNAAINEQIAHQQKLFSCGILTYEQMLDGIQEMEDKRKEILKEIHPYAITKVRDVKAGDKKTHYRWVTRVPDETAKNGRYRKIQSRREENVYHQLYLHYGLIDEGTKERPHPLSLAGLYERWIQYRLAKVRPGTVKKDQAVWKRYYEGDPITWKSLASIKASEAFLWLSQKVSDYGLNYRKYSELRAVWTQIEGLAYNDDLIPRRVMQNVERPGRNIFSRTEQRYRETETYTKDEIQLLTTTALDLYHKSHFNTAYLGLILEISTGFRAGELVCLRWDGINKEAKTITINQSESPKYTFINGAFRNQGFEVLDHLKKGHSERTVPLPPQAEEVLDYIRLENEKHGIHSEYVFVQKNGERVHTRAFQKAIKKIHKLHGWEHKTGGIHEFRRTYATSLIEGNVDDKSIQSWMGHKDWTTTKRYYQYSPKTPDPEAAAAVSAAIWGENAQTRLFSGKIDRTT